jgi:hypothetical protein
MADAPSPDRHLGAFQRACFFLRPSDSQESVYCFAAVEEKFVTCDSALPVDACCGSYATVHPRHSSRATSTVCDARVVHGSSALLSLDDSDDVESGLSTRALRDGVFFVADMYFERETLSENKKLELGDCGTCNQFQTMSGPLRLRRNRSPLSHVHKSFAAAARTAPVCDCGAPGFHFGLETFSRLRRELHPVAIASGSILVLKPSRGCGANYTPSRQRRSGYHFGL